MSFSSETKRELCRVPVKKLCCARAEAYGILLYCNTFHTSEARIITGNPDLAERLPKLFQKAFQIRFDNADDAPEIKSPEETPKSIKNITDLKASENMNDAPENRTDWKAPRETPESITDLNAPENMNDAPTGKRVFKLTDRVKLRRVMDILGYERSPVLHINFALLEEDCCKAAFLRGAFFAGGSVTDPVKRYHLELTTSHAQVGRELEALLREVGYPPKNIMRSGSFVSYYKQSDQIEDFLTMIGAPVSAMRVMTAKLEKDLNNKINRRINCDSANLDKSVEASREQTEAIRKLRDADMLKNLSNKLQITAALRLEYPELALSELAEEFDPPVTKSCLNHRMRKLIELARGL